MTAGVEQAIADVFTALDGWLVSTGATASMERLAWAVLTVLWLGYVAASSRPGRQLDLIEAFGRLIVAGGLLTAVGPVTRAIQQEFYGVVRGEKADKHNWLTPVPVNTKQPVAV